MIALSQIKNIGKKLIENIISYCVVISGHTSFSKLSIPKFILGGNRSQFGKEAIQNMKSTENGLKNSTLKSVIIELEIAEEQAQAVNIMAHANFKVKDKSTRNWA